VANLKSQIKRNRQNLKRRLRNRFYRGAARSAVYQARAAVDSGAPDSKEAVMQAISILDKAAERGVLHRNNAARRKARLMRRLAALGAPLAPTKTAKPLMTAGTAVAEEPTEPQAKEGGRKPAKKAAAKKAAVKKPARTTVKK
jgi:small subunit ribosomal protein S20